MTAGGGGTVIINGRFLSQRLTGVQRFAREIVQASAAQGWMSGAKILVPQGDAAASFAGIPVSAAGKRGGHAWEQFELPRACGDDVLLNLCNSAPVLRRRQLVVLHDAAVAANPGNFTFPFRAWYQVMIRLYGRRAQTIGTVSRFSAGEIAKHFGIPPAKIEVIPESGEHILRAQPDYSVHEKLGLEQDGYFLAVSSLAPNKNFSRVLEAVAKLPPMPFKFVIVGAGNAKIFNAGNTNLSGAVEAGYVTDAQLRALYERAACFVYPSLYEGFGLPPLEAMTCGCPVLVSNTTSLPEACGDAALYCDPHDPSDIARQLGLLLGSASLRDERRSAGLAHAGEWTWAKASERLREITAQIS